MRPPILTGNWGRAFSAWIVIHRAHCNCAGWRLLRLRFEGGR